jgi:hypothetical protein
MLRIVRYFILLILILSSLNNKTDAIVKQNVRLTPNQFKFLDNSCKNLCKNDNYCIFKCIQTGTDHIKYLNKPRRTYTPSEKH